MRSRRHPSGEQRFYASYRAGANIAGADLPTPRRGARPVDRWLP
ncbi:hypothetical protein ACWGI0_08880 [Streptomyces sp. NPDC054802]